MVGHQQHNRVKHEHAYNFFAAQEQLMLDDIENRLRTYGHYDRFRRNFRYLDTRDVQREIDLVALDDLGARVLLIEAKKTDGHKQWQKAKSQLHIHLENAPRIFPGYQPYAFYAAHPYREARIIYSWVHRNIYKQEYS